MPTASPDGVRHVMVLEPVGLQMPAPPPTLAEEAKPRVVRKAGRK
jgi:rod shape-determining protein MreC